MAMSSRLRPESKFYERRRCVVSAFERKCLSMFGQSAGCQQSTTSKALQRPHGDLVRRVAPGSDACRAASSTGTRGRPVPGWPARASPEIYPRSGDILDTLGRARLNREATVLEVQVISGRGQ